MKNVSLWKAKTVNYRSNNIIKTEMKTDILIIGAGMAGMSVALTLLENNQKFMVVDRKKAGMGVTGNSTGKLTFAQGLVYSDIIKMHCYGTALKYYKSQREAIDIAVDNIKKYKIDCDYQMVDSYVFAENKKDIEKIKDEEKFYRKLGLKYKRVFELPNNYSIKYGIKFSDTGVFNPVKYVLGIKEIIDKSSNKIYENTTVTEIKRTGDSYIVETDRGKIYASKVVVCSHYPFFIVPGLIPFRSYIEKSYILASEVKDFIDISAITALKPTISMRYSNIDGKKYFLFASNSHKSATTLNLKKQFDDMINKYNVNFNEKIDFIWSAHDVMTADKIPYIGRVSSKDKNLFIATGFNKWGMTNGIISGKVIGDLIMHKSNNYINLFSLQRKVSMIRFFRIILDNVLTVSTLVFNKIVRNHKFYSESVRIIEEDGKKIGVYRSGDKVYKVSNTCPHMKCSLLFNEFEKTWDCPCHGSRFDIKGNAISGPSTYSIKLKKRDD